MTALFCRGSMHLSVVITTNYLTIQGSNFWPILSRFDQTSGTEIPTPLGPFGTLNVSVRDLQILIIGTECVALIVFGTVRIKNCREFNKSSTVEIANSQ